MRRHRYTVVLHPKSSLAVTLDARTNAKRTSKLPSGDSSESLGRVLRLRKQDKHLAKVLDRLARLDIDLALVCLDRPRDLRVVDPSGPLRRHGNDNVP